ncbi:GNAT family N-acetyltransferase [Halobacterium zhouii]|uniref:GNAT family N-acetyltransferase n=1 Tax=Halobacterium zhouii TaxID=2902624 RepID=UPI001E32EBFC|nr:GNAT family N-acetyltransferase [Halobacterium zhouii]
MENVELRPAEESDVDAITEVARAAWHAAYDDVLGPDTVEDTVDDWYHEAEIRGVVDGPCFLVAESEGVIGFAHASELADKQGVAELYRLYVHPDHWGDGVGSALLDRVEGSLRERGVERLQTVVIAANEVGRSFYEDRGFEPVTELGSELPGAEMELLLAHDL